MVSGVVVVVAVVDVSAVLFVVSMEWTTILLIRRNARGLTHVRSVLVEGASSVVSSSMDRCGALDRIDSASSF
jgi:hypothetical protein